MKQVTIKDSG